MPKKNKHTGGSSNIINRVLSILGMATGLWLLVAVLPAAAQTCTWVGGTDSDWHNSANWNSCSGSTPGAGATVQIRPQGGNPYPEITQDVTISTLTLSLWYSGGDVTISSGATLTITNTLNMYSNANMYILGSSAVDLTGSINFNGNGSQVIDIDASGTFTSASAFTLEGTFNAGSGTVNFDDNFTVSSNRSFNTESATVTVDNTTEINGTYNGDDGNTTFNGNVDVRDGGIINLDTGTITFNSQTHIRSNGTLNMGSGTVNLNAGLTAESDGHINVQDGNLNVQGDATFQNDGNLSVDDGNVSVTGDATLQNGGSFDFTNGSMSVGGDASFTNGGTVNAGNSQIDLKGDMTVESGGDFQPGTSTVTFSGGDTQTINAGNNDVTFHNVNVTDGSSLQTDGSSGNTVIVENNMSVEDGSSVQVQGDDNIDVQGDLDNNGDVQSQDPFVYDISTPSTTEVLVAYDQKMDPTSAGNASNYAINNSITVNSATFNTSNDSTVTLSVSTLSQNTEYELTVNNVESASGREISTNHIKRFNVMVQITYYSRTSGDWDNANSWSTDSHSGSAASSIPNAQNDEKAVIGSGHTITLSSTQDITNMDELTVDGTGTLTVASSDTLILKEFTIIGNGTFTLQAGGTLYIGSPDGIVASGTAEGNIQTSTRNFSSSGNYVYDGSSAQVTGSGLPTSVNDLRVDNSAGVTASSNLQTGGTLYLSNGSLFFPSGQQLIANSKSVGNGDLIFTRIISGNQGWRMLSSPVNTTYDDFLDSTVTQGYQNSKLGLQDGNGNPLQPTVLYYDETNEGTDNQRWRAPASASSVLTAGRGLNVYFFGEVSVDDRYNNALPDTLTTRGQEFSGTGGNVDMNVTYTAEADTGWNLVGNPYAAAIDWDDNANWTSTNIDNTIYVWDPADESYKTWNGSTGSLGNGLIPPFQAFWIKANANNPSLAVNEEAKTFGGNFVGKQVYPANPRIAFQLSDGEHRSELFLSFTQESKRGKDPNDAYCLLPPADIGSYLQLYSLDEQGNRYSISSLPRQFGTSYEIPLHTRFVKSATGEHADNRVTLSWPEMKEIPASWSIMLTDRLTGREIDLSRESEYNFNLEPIRGKSKKQVGTGKAKPKSYKIVTKFAPQKARFLLTINPGAEGTGLPNKIGIKQNYPNPFNPSTTIRFTLPIQNEVSLKIYDMLGRQVATLIDERGYAAGQHSVTWNASGFPSGVYFYRLTTPERTLTKKLTLIK